jgi:2-dehydro-3-deoxygluconokinase
VRHPAAESRRFAAADRPFAPDEIADFYLELGAADRRAEDGGRGRPARPARANAFAFRPPRAGGRCHGAGDTFDGSFLARLIAGDDPETAARYANVAAALSTTGYGAVTPIPRRRSGASGARPPMSRGAAASRRNA